ncbi:omega-conotoxin-like protein 1 isoform X2 [Megachile rotundata]|uniref:omega-conotoxin-like protein 1 isoform X2 n=1 Tax=Megachile rotundata TaxID=143995 RepID=UPI000258D8E0|nr:PREDICTED: omega-conotoxin-like protein 1 [Megachile rotundata]
MSKFTMLIFVFLVAATIVTAAPERCGRHGDDCVASSDCCRNLSCNRFAHRCQVVITEEELMAQREKILGRKGKDY